MTYKRLNFNTCKKISSRSIIELNFMRPAKEPDEIQ